MSIQSSKFVAIPHSLSRRQWPLRNGRVMFLVARASYIDGYWRGTSLRRPISKGGAAMGTMGLTRKWGTLAAAASMVALGIATSLGSSPAGASKLPGQYGSLPAQSGNRRKVASSPLPSSRAAGLPTSSPSPPPRISAPTTSVNSSSSSGPRCGGLPRAPSPPSTMARALASRPSTATQQDHHDHAQVWLEVVRRHTSDIDRRGVHDRLAEGRRRHQPGQRR